MLFFSQLRGYKLVKTIIALNLVFSIIWNEKISISWYVSRCKSQSSTSSSSTWSSYEEEAPLLKMVLISNPELIDFTWTKMLGSRQNPLLRIIEFEQDVRMKRQFSSILSTIDPNLIVIMGDMFHGTLQYTSNDWIIARSRFGKIFQTNNNNNNLDGNNKTEQTTNENSNNSKKRYILNVAGPNDIPWNDFYDLREAASNFGNTFGPINHEFDVNGIRIVTLTAQLNNGDNENVRDLIDPSLQIEFKKFVEEWQKKTSGSVEYAQQPSILFTSTSLWRDTSLNCGKQSLSDSLERSRKVLSSNLTTLLLEIFQPIHVFSVNPSGACEIVHYLKNQSFQESLTTTFSPINSFQSTPSFTVLEINKKMELMKTQCSLPALPWWSYCWNLVLTFVILLVFGMRPGSTSAKHQKDSLSFMFSLSIGGLCFYWILAVWDLFF